MTPTLRWLLAGSMIALAGACASPPPGPDLALTQMSREKRFLVTLVPPEGALDIQQMQTWHIKLATPAGTPIPKALVYLNGGMPEHGHGLPTRPAVTREIAPGTYQLDGLKFSMPGWWELIVAIQVNGMEDMAYFNQVIALPAAGK